MRINLFCFPFAGGSKYSYNNLSRAAGKHLRLIPMDYPGRGVRFKEPLLTVMEEIADDCFDRIKDNLDHPYAIYGHSMGTLVSYLVTRRIVQEGGRLPLHLFLSGRGGPSDPPLETDRYLLPKDKFRARLREMGGNSDEVLDDEELMRFFEPVLRADFEAVETYPHAASEALDVPITVMIGEEEKITADQAGSWQKETLHPIDVRTFPGKHFFIFEQAPALMEIIQDKLFSAIDINHHKHVFYDNSRTDALNGRAVPVDLSPGTAPKHSF